MERVEINWRKKKNRNVNIGGTCGTVKHPTFQSCGRAYTVSISTALWVKKHRAVLNLGLQPNG